MKTPLYNQHVLLGAKMINFCGWEMPIQYEGIIQEHLIVRNAIGLFDVSHMGRIEVIGKEAEQFLDYLSTNSIFDKKSFSATYTILPNAEGGSIDDVIIYKQNSEHFFIIVNASNRKKDLEHLLNYSKTYNVKIIPHFQDEAILSIQGPKSLELMRKMFSDCFLVGRMYYVNTHFEGCPIILSRTGYSGEEGFELYVPLEIAVPLWNALLKVGKQYGIAPIGLGARDTLRLEMGYALYGNELSEEISSLESVAAWNVKLQNRDFLGKEKLKTFRHAYGIFLIGKGIARAGYLVYDKDRLVGTVTSGNYSPSLKQAIALILVNQQYSEGKNIQIRIRDVYVEAKIVKLPFYTRGSL